MTNSNPAGFAARDPNDLTTVAADAFTSPELHSAGMRGGHTRRRKILMTLLDDMNELSRDETLGTEPDLCLQPSFHDERKIREDRGRDAEGVNIAMVDDHLQNVGADSWDRFQKRITNLDKELCDLCNAAQQLGRSVGILSSAFHLRERLTQIAYLFRENAADLFPSKVSHQPKESIVLPNIGPRSRERARSKAPPHLRRPPVLGGLDPEDFPLQLGWFAREVMTFLDCLNELPESADDAVNASIIAFEGDLKYWASCLRTYEGQFRYPAVQRYLHDLTSEMGEHFESITSSLSRFIEIGVPGIRSAQKHSVSNLLMLSTVATFFSAVTATTLQYSFDMKGTLLLDSVNAFWFTSMVFSTTAVVNSLLGVMWQQALYRSPFHRTPWWVLFWIKRSPLVFLALSVACFSAGLVLFTYSSQQSYVVSTITTVLTAFSSFGLVAVSTWFALERQVFNRHKGEKWLDECLDDFSDELLGIPSLLADKTVNLYQRITSLFVPTRSRAMDASSRHTNTFSFSRPSLDAPEAYSPEDWLPSALESGLTPESELTSPRGRRGSDGAYETAAAFEPKSPTLSEKGNACVPSVASSPTSPAPVPEAPSPGRTCLRNAVRRVIMMRAAEGRGAAIPMRTSRVANLVPKLKHLQATMDIETHTALVRHLQFSPNGKFLATSSWDRTSVIFRVGDPFTPHRILAHPTGFVSQVAWSQSGNMLMLLTKLTHAIKVWTEAGVCTKTIDRQKLVQSICWLPGGEAFMSVEGGDVVKLDLTGNVLDTYSFNRLTILDVTVTRDNQRMLGVGTLLSSQDGLQPSKRRAEKQIIAYSLDKKEIENQVPVLHDIRNITLARNHDVALVSYEFKAPPQLWKLEMVRDRGKGESSVTSRLSLRHTYMPKFPVEFAGPSHFGGKDDQIVLCAGKAGDIHIWDRESASLLHHIPAQVLGGDLTCLTWNSAADPFMFATGSHDGTVHIWTSPPTLDAPADASQRSLRHGAVTHGSSTYLGTEYHTDSPNQRDFDDISHRGNLTEDHEPPSQRTNAFTEPQAPGALYSPTHPASSS